MVLFLSEDNQWLPGSQRCHGAGDPYWCIAAEIPRSSDSLGILYMQFDVAMSPCEMSKRLEIGQVGTFEDLSDKYVTFKELDECNLNEALHCLWHHWDVKNTRQKLLKSLQALERAPALSFSNELKSTSNISTSSILEKLRSGIWRAVSDFLYIPKQVFEIYETLESWFARFIISILSEFEDGHTMDRSDMI